MRSDVRSEKVAKALSEVIKASTCIIELAVDALNERNGCPPVSALEKVEKLRAMIAVVSDSSIAAIRELAAVCDEYGVKR